MLVPVSTAAAIDDINTTKLRNAVKTAGILGHERVLQRIANQNGGTRASGTPGYDASAQYVKKTLKDAGYQVSEQKFTFPFFRALEPAVVEQVSPTPTPYASSTLTYSGSGDVTGTVVVAGGTTVPPTAGPGLTSSGCAASDFVPASSTPQIALVQRGTCTFEIKANNAQAAGYDAVVIFNEGQTGRTELLAGTLGNLETIPVVGLSYADGAALVDATEAGPVTLHVFTSTEADLAATTSNIIANTPKGNKDKVVVVGSHLDSVVAGPGINDNGSGTATILETAVQMAKLKIEPRQQVRFAFWGAEELGLLGSNYYVNNLSDQNLDKIYANLNFDMLGSPNYVRFVYDGDGSDSDPAGPPGSGQIEQIFTSYFASQNLASAPTEFSGRSDYGPFIAVGIPAGGLFSGAEGVKTPEEAAIYGGTAGVAYDVCYHQACDTVNNLSTKALGEMGDAVADSVLTLAKTKSGFFEDGSRVAARQAISLDQFDSRGGLLLR
jgi:Zn-dependent M28 family amino/carboxypeptidase